MAVPAGQIDARGPQTHVGVDQAGDGLPRRFGWAGPTADPGPPGHTSPLPNLRPRARPVLPVLGWPPAKTPPGVPGAVPGRWPPPPTGEFVVASQHSNQPPVQSGLFQLVLGDETAEKRTWPIGTSTGDNVGGRPLVTAGRRPPSPCAVSVRSACQVRQNKDLPNEPACNRTLVTTV